MSPHIFDMISTRNAILYSGKDYNVTNIAALPAAFTTDFTPAVLVAGAAQAFLQKEFPNCAKLGFQIVIAVAGGGLTKVEALLQCSNIGGTDAAVWADVTTATDCGSTASSKFVTLPANMDAARHAKFYRLQLTATGGAATVYAVAYGYAES